MVEETPFYHLSLGSLFHSISALPSQAYFDVLMGKMQFDSKLIFKEPCLRLDLLICMGEDSVWRLLHSKAGIERAALA